MDFNSPSRCRTDTSTQVSVQQAPSSYQIRIRCFRSQVNATGFEQTTLPLVIRSADHPQETAVNTEPEWWVSNVTMMIDSAFLVVVEPRAFR